MSDESSMSSTRSEVFSGQEVGRAEVLEPHYDTMLKRNFLFFEYFSLEPSSMIYRYSEILEIITINCG